ncbi:hypothetical protein OPV09_02680 [Janthinobacterium sp. TB1-E2]|uniref:Uncharacterized protein n=1 Tax=Janthinobacterium aestuarii TaxID=2985511 RepID=A0ABZ2GMI8_9BURK
MFSALRKYIGQGTLPVSRSIVAKTPSLAFFLAIAHSILEAGPQIDAARPKILPSILFAFHDWLLNGSAFVMHRACGISLIRTIVIHLLVRDVIRVMLVSVMISLFVVH